MCRFGDGGHALPVARVEVMEDVPSRHDAIQRGRPVSETKQSVVILYEHALLGEGIAKYLRTHSGVEAKVAPGHDLEAVTSALAHGPTVVIFELSEPVREFDLAALAPQAVLIDVSAVVTRGSSATPDAAGLERLLQAVSGPAAPPMPLTAEVSLPAESCLGRTLAAPAR